MTDNEIIAEWLDWKWSKWEIKALHDGWTYTVDGIVRLAWSPLTDITIWHGPDGLLKKIKDTRLMFDFIIELGRVLDIEADLTIVPEDIPSFMMATPAQLAAALVATIKEVEDEAG